jgi:uncharacterized membrane protein
VETKHVIAVISEAIEVVGVVVIAAGVVIGVGLFAWDLLRQAPINDAYTRLRTFLGRALLLGLEFLVAGDIIWTVFIAPTRDRVIVLTVIVLVRTVLSLSIDVEIDGRWPWQAAEQEALARAAQVRDVASVETGTRTGRGGARDR